MSAFPFGGPPTSPSPSPSLLYYLFADRALPATRCGHKAPCSEARVNALDLASLLLGAAFWSLREQGLI